MLIQDVIESKEELIKEIDETLVLMLGNIPPVMVNAVKTRAFDAIEEQVAEDAAVEELRQELKDL